MPKDSQIPEKYLCSITGQIMIDPVMAADGHTYEREAIEQWLQTHDTSPRTNAKLKHKELTDEHDKQSDILAFLESHPELYNEGEVYLPKTPFHLAATRNDVFLLARLLKTKLASCIDAEDTNGDTALHLAARGEHEDMIYLLLEADAYHKLKNKQGQTPGELAIAQQKSKIANFIVKTVKSLKQSKLKEQAGKIAQLEAALVQESKQNSELNITLESQEKIFKTQLLSIEQTLNEARNKYESLTADMLQSMGEQIKQLRFVFSEKAKPSSNSGVSNIKPAAPAIDEKDVREFLRLVAEGEQDKAEAMLKSNPSLALVPGDVTDLSKRTFNSITGFQYAVWAIDWHMWTMIRKYLPFDEAQRQAQGFETGEWVRQHGVHAQHLLDGLVKALQLTLGLYTDQIYTEGNRAWVQQVRRAQLLLPVHVINEYCHPTRSFDPVPDFREAVIFPRTRAVGEEEWFTVMCRADSGFAVLRSSGLCCWKTGELETRYSSSSYDAWRHFGWPQTRRIDHDLGSVRALSSTRIAQREELINELKPRVAQIKAL